MANVMGMFRRVFLSSMIVFAALVLAETQSPAQNLGDQLIVPGERVGSIRIGMYEDELRSLLGKPTSTVTYPYSSGSQLQYNYDALNVQIFVGLSGGGAPQVASISVFQYASRDYKFVTAVWSDFKPLTSNFRTAEGIGLGSPSFDVARKIGKDYADIGDIWMRYQRKGIRFLPTTDHRVFAIGVDLPQPGN